MNEANGENDMGNTVDMNVAGILAMLADTRRSAGGGFYGGGGEGGACGVAPWAGPGSNAARIEGISSDVSDLRNEFREGRLSDTMVTGFTAVNKNVTDGFQHACDKAEAVAVRLSDGQRDLVREMSANFRASELKMCAIEKQQAVDTGLVISEIKASETRGVRDLLDVERAQRIALQTQVNCGCTTGCSQPCGGHHGGGHG